MTQPTYMQEPWFQVLLDTCKRVSQAEVARQLGTSQPQICQVINGRGLYGTGKASTKQLRAKVEMHQALLEGLQAPPTGPKPPKAAPGAYMQEPWFKLLQDACEKLSQSEVALQLGVSQPLISQVINGSGLYGSGRSSTTNLAQKVEAVLGKFECPYLTEIMGESRVIDVKRCRLHAHVRMPNTPLAYEHWKECRKCPKFALTAPPPPPPPVPKKRRKPAASPESTQSTTTPTKEPTP